MPPNVPGIDPQQIGSSTQSNSDQLHLQANMPSHQTRIQAGYKIGKGNLPKNRATSPRCYGRIWIFLVLGCLLVVLGVVIGGVYFNIQAITSSSDNTDTLTLPTYINSIAVILTGFGVTVLFWRRFTALVYVAVLLCASSGILCVISSVLTVVNIILPLLRRPTCIYNSAKFQCICYANSNVGIDYEQSMLFLGASSCASVKYTLPSLLFTLCGVYGGVLVFSTASVIIALLILRLERTSRIQDEIDAYDDVFTVSGGSSTVSDSDNECSLVPGHHKTASVNNVNIKQQYKDDRSAVNLESNTILAKPAQSKQGQGLSIAKRLSKSCDSLVDLEKESTGAKNKIGSKANDGKKGKLKEHRRRKQRAVTLPNLDTKQLMLILDLQMRYLEENKRLDTSEQHCNGIEVQPRRAKTPNPPQASKPNTMPRSRTPQPYKQPSYAYGYVTSNLPTDWHPKEIYQQIDKVRYRQQNRSADSRSKFIENNEMGNIHSCTKKNGKQHSVNIYENVDDDVYIQNQNINKSESTPVFQNAASRHHSVGPRSRPSAKKHFLPSEPLHRHYDESLPPQPISRQTVQKHCLPAKPMQRRPSPHHQGTNHSAFQRVEQTKYAKECGNYDFSGRENFQLLPQQFMLRNEENDAFYPTSDISCAATSEPPPPYAPPPSYNHYLTRMRDSEPCLDTTEHFYNHGRQMSPSSQAVSYSSHGRSSKSSIKKPAAFIRAFSTPENGTSQYSQGPKMYENMADVEDFLPSKLCSSEQFYQQARPKSKQTPRETGDITSTSKVSVEREDIYSQVNKSTKRCEISSCVATREIPENFYARVNKKSQKPFTQNGHIDYENVDDQPDVGLDDTSNSNEWEPEVSLYEDMYTAHDAQVGYKEEYYEDVNGNGSNYAASTDGNSHAMKKSSPKIKENSPRKTNGNVTYNQNGEVQGNDIHPREHVIDIMDISSGEEMESAI